MKKRITMVLALMITALLAFGALAAATTDPDAPDYTSTKTARFNVMEDMPTYGGAEFSMISEDGELVIHIHADTPVYFEDYVPMSDEEEDGVTRNAREVLFGRTLAEVLDNRNLTVTYAITTRSIPPQTSPLSVVILFETAVHLPIEVDGALELDLDSENGEYAGFVTLPASLLPFTDVDVNDWFFTPVAWAYTNDIMNGTSETEFSPEATMTRAMLVTVLWRYAGQPAADAAHAFGDVVDGRWYSTAVAWAAENDIVTGLNETTFAPEDYINREQMYTILYRYMNFSGVTIELEEEMRLQQFADDDLVSDWAREALHFMFDAGVMFRYHDFDYYARPQADATRSEIAAAMYFFDMWAN